MVGCVGFELALGKWNYSDLLVLIVWAIVGLDSLLGPNIYYWFLFRFNSCFGCLFFWNGWLCVHYELFVLWFEYAIGHQGLILIGLFFVLLFSWFNGARVGCFCDFGMGWNRAHSVLILFDLQFDRSIAMAVFDGIMIEFRAIKMFREILVKRPYFEKATVKLVHAYRS